MRCQVLNYKQFVHIETLDILFFLWHRGRVIVTVLIRPRKFLYMNTQEGVTPKPAKEEAHTPMEATEMLRTIMTSMATKDDIALIHATMATKEDLKAFATKEDVRSMIGEAKQELKDHTTRECAKVRGDLVSVAHRQDEKINEFVRTAQKCGTISRAHADRLTAINPFMLRTD